MQLCVLTLQLKVQEYLPLNPCQSQGQAEDVDEQLHGDQSSGQGLTGEAWKDSRAGQKVPWLLHQQPFLLFPSLCEPRHIGHQGRS